MIGDFTGAEKTGIVLGKGTEETDGRHVHHRRKGYYESFSYLVSQHKCMFSTSVSIRSMARAILSIPP